MLTQFLVQHFGFYFKDTEKVEKCEERVCHLGNITLHISTNFCCYTVDLKDKILKN